MTRDVPAPDGTEIRFRQEANKKGWYRFSISGATFNQYGPRLFTHRHSEVIKWLRREFGTKDEKRWHVGYNVVMLRDEIDAVCFKLRWV